MSMHLEPSTRVEQGELLFSIDTAEYQPDLEEQGDYPNRNLTILYQNLLKGGFRPRLCKNSK